MVDFYTLLLVMTDIENTLPLAQDKRDQLRERLLNFGNDITAYQKRGDEEKEHPPEHVLLYASGIHNSSDLNSRKTVLLHSKPNLLLSKLSCIKITDMGTNYSAHKSVILFTYSFMISLLAFALSSYPSLAPAAGVSPPFSAASVPLDFHLESPALQKCINPL